jgi:hypothetical protein
VLEFTEEDRVEVVVNDKGQREEIKRVVQELKVVRSTFLIILKFSHCFQVHPYEEVAYDVYKLEDL